MPTPACALWLRAQGSGRAAAHAQPVARPSERRQLRLPSGADIGGQHLPRKHARGATRTSAPPHAPAPPLQCADRQRPRALLAPPPHAPHPVTAPVSTFVAQMPPRSAVAHGARREDELVLLQVLARLALRAARPSRPNLGPQRGRVSLARAHVPRFVGSSHRGGRGGGAAARGGGGPAAGRLGDCGGARAARAAAAPPDALPHRARPLVLLLHSLLHSAHAQRRSSRCSLRVCYAAGCRVDRLFG